MDVWTTAAPAVAAAFLASLVEVVEAFTIVLAVATVRGWKPALLGTGAALVVLAVLVSVFGLAGIPPFVGFMGKFGLLTAALAQGHLALVIVAVINSAVAIYYYLRLVRAAFFGVKNADAAASAPEAAPIALNLSTVTLCVLLMSGIILFGIAPASVLETITRSLAEVRFAVSG